MNEKKDLKDVKNERLERLLSALEDQDFVLESIIEKMPKSDERYDLEDVRKQILNLMELVDLKLSK